MFPLIYSKWEGYVNLNLFGNWQLWKNLFFDSVDI